MNQFTPSLSGIGSGAFFSVKEIKRVAPLDNLISFTVSGDITEQGRFSPVRPAESLKEKDPLFYPFFSNSRFQIKQTQKTLSFPERLDFLTYTSVSDLPPDTLFVFNQAGEAVSVVTEKMEYTLFGRPLSVLRAFLGLTASVEGQAQTVSKKPPETAPLYLFEDSSKTVLQGDSPPAGDLQSEDLVSIRSLRRLKPQILDFSGDKSPLSLRGHLVKAKTALYKQAQAGDSRSAHRLIQFTGGNFNYFKSFMESIGEDDLIHIKKEWKVFWKLSALWDPGYYFHRYKEKIEKPTKGLTFSQLSSGSASVLSFPSWRVLSSNPDRKPSRPSAGREEGFTLLSFPGAETTEMNGKPGESDTGEKRKEAELNEVAESAEGLDFLSEQIPARELAEGGHPHFQFVMGVIDFERGDTLSSARLIQESGQAGYLPALFYKAVQSFASGFQSLLKLAENDYAPAKKSLSLLAYSLKQAEEFVRQYNSDGLKPYFPKPGHSRTFFQRWRDVWRGDISFAEKEYYVYEDSLFFDESVRHLTEGFDLLSFLSNQNFPPAAAFRDNFSERVRTLTQIPFSRPGKKLNRECSYIFSAYFIPSGKPRR